jgi:release factor glutamine methyltransferase
MIKSMNTIGHLLRRAAEVLKGNDPSSPLLEAEMLLTFVLKKDKVFLYAHPDHIVGLWDRLCFKHLLNKRLRAWPIAYLVKHQWFYGLDFFVNKDTLIPRPETELMVDEALKLAKSEELKVQNIIDLGTGSGCIIISLAKNLEKISGKINLFGVDISKRALAVAKRNAEKNGVDGCIKFLHSDLLKVIDFEKINGSTLITANLPYLTPVQVESSPSIKKEPKKALISGPDGLKHYRELFKQVSVLAAEFRKGLLILCEIDDTQVAAFSLLVNEFFPGAVLMIKKDLSGFDRLGIIKL